MTISRKIISVLTAALATAVPLAAAGTAQAETFESTGQHEYTVPEGVEAITATLTGGTGGGGCYDGSGGAEPRSPRRSRSSRGRRSM
jgi:N-methylhydantoinase B/oxoprolinase/acetone carboxylase alpha subunit